MKPDEIITERIRVSPLGCYAVIRKTRNEVYSEWEHIELSTDPPLELVEESKERTWP